MKQVSWIEADWPTPANIKAGTTTRCGGVGRGRYESFNLALHVGDEPDAVKQNRQTLTRVLNLPSEPHWLNQRHGCDVSTDNHRMKDADAGLSSETNRVCVVMTADCLPVLISDVKGTCVAAIHAGWRGLAAGIITSTIKKMPATGDQLLVWLGPAIGPEAFEVGPEVRASFVCKNSAYADAFVPNKSEKYFMNIYQAARIELQTLGVERVYGGDFCTFENGEQFYSHRRDQQTGRMASLIWIEA